MSPILELPQMWRRSRLALWRVSRWVTRIYSRLGEMGLRMPEVETSMTSLLQHSICPTDRPFEWWHLLSCRHTREISAPLEMPRFLLLECCNLQLLISLEFGLSHQTAN